MTILSGESMCECTQCGRVFTTISAFDTHQTGTDKVKCHDPLTLKKPLEIKRHTEDAAPVWGYPSPPEGKLPNWFREVEK